MTDTWNFCRRRKMNSALLLASSLKFKALFIFVVASMYVAFEQRAATGVHYNRFESLHTVLKKNGAESNEEHQTGGYKTCTCNTSSITRIRARCAAVGLRRRRRSLSGTGRLATSAWTCYVQRFDNDNKFDINESL